MTVLKRLIVIPLLVLVLAGCENVMGPRPEKKEVADGAPPEPTAQDIAQKIITTAQLDMPVPNRKNVRFSTVIKNNMLNTLQSSYSANNADIKGKEAIKFVSQRLDKRIREFKAAEQWEYVLGFTDGYVIFNPGSKKYAHLRDTALVELRKPRVKLSGLPTLAGLQRAILTFYVPLDNKTYEETMYVGEELHGLKMVNVFGKGLGVTMEYLETGERFVVYLPSKR